jgi:hypothetical protein
MDRDEFLEYLRETLIPDLREAGNVRSAKDFETAVRFIEDRDLNFVDLDN